MVSPEANFHPTPCPGCRSTPVKIGPGFRISLPSIMLYSCLPGYTFTLVRCSTNLGCSYNAKSIVPIISPGGAPLIAPWNVPVKGFISRTCTEATFSVIMVKVAPLSIITRPQPEFIPPNIEASKNY